MNFSLYLAKRFYHLGNTDKIWIPRFMSTIYSKLNKCYVFN